MELRSHSDCLRYLYSLEKFGISLGLHKIERLLIPFSNPQDSLKVIHIAGTNGKGSTAAIIESILMHHGLTVGLYTSPHLVRFNERIRVNREEIKDEEIVELTKRLKPIADKINLSDPVTFFDFTTAMAYIYFYEKGVDFAIIEVGLGGRLDSTNIVKKPKISIITNISKEHEKYLGSDLKDIAFEKCGIIKNGVPVITGEEKIEPLEVIKREANAKNSPLYVLKECCNIEIKDTKFNYSGIKSSFENLSVNLIGKHQIKNSCLAILACEVIDEIRLEEKKLKEALKDVKWEGRFEILKKDPFFILDGAHNPEGARVLSETIKTFFPNKKVIFILSIMSDKNIEEILSHLIPLAKALILTKAEIDRAEEIANLQKIARKFIEEDRIFSFEKIDEAVKFSLEIADKNDLICFSGSLYAVGDLKKCAHYLL